MIRARAPVRGIFWRAPRAAIFSRKRSGYVSAPNKISFVTRLRFEIVSLIIWVRIEERNHGCNDRYGFFSFYRFAVWSVYPDLNKFLINRILILYWMFLKTCSSIEGRNEMKWQGRRRISIPLEAALNSAASGPPPAPSGSALSAVIYCAQLWPRKLWRGRLS